MSKKRDASSEDSKKISSFFQPFGQNSDHADRGPKRPNTGSSAMLLGTDVEQTDNSSTQGMCTLLYDSCIMF